MSWNKPTPEKIQELLPRLSSPQLETYFFERLANPLWIRPLIKLDFFSHAPHSVDLGEGRMVVPRWSPSRYLKNMAKRAPEDVADGFVQVAAAKPDNFYIVWDAIDAALEMPAEHSVRILPFILRSAQTKSLGMGYDDAAKLCKKLAKEGKVMESLELFDALFQPEDDSKGGYGHRHGGVYTEKDGLEIVAGVMSALVPVEFLKRLCRWLDKLIEQDAYGDAESDNDWSYSWRPAIEDHGQNRDWDTKSVLVGFIRAGLEHAIHQRSLPFEAAHDLLAKRKYQVYQRIDLHLINTFAKDHKELAIEKMMSRELFDDYVFKHEYAKLMEARFKLLPAHQRVLWFSWVDEGPDMSNYDEEVAQATGSTPTDKQRESRVNWWKYEKLHWIREHLEGDRKEFYERMLEEHGKPELSDLNSFTTMRVGEESPVEAGDLKDKPLAEVLEIVNEWRPSESQYFKDPSIEGLAETFSKYIAADVVGFSSQAALLKDSNPIFIRKYLGRMTEAVDQGDAIDLNAILGLCDWVLEQEVVTETTDVDWMVHDNGWQWARDWVTRLVESICKAQTEKAPRYRETDCRNSLWMLLEVLCREPSRSTILRDTSEEDPRQHDRLDLAINSPRGRAIQAMFAYARWLFQQLKDVNDKGREFIKGGFEAMPEVRDMLEWQIAGENRTAEALSIIGSNLNLIYGVDREWLAEHKDSIFALDLMDDGVPDAPGWAAWNAFLVWTPAHVEYFRIFRSQFETAVDYILRLESVTDRPYTDPIHHLGQHLVVLYGRGDISIDGETDLLRRIVHSGPPELRRHLIEYIGQSLRSDESLPQEVVDRFMTLWELYWPVPGMDDAAKDPSHRLFGEWFATGQFPKGWALNQLVDFAEVVGVPEPDHDVGEKLVEFVELDLNACLKVLRQMILGDKEGWHIHSLVEPAKTILRAALHAGGPEKSEAVQLIDVLGRRGFIEMGELLKTDSTG